MTTILALHQTYEASQQSSHLHHVLLRRPSEKVFDQSNFRTKEQKVRLQCLDSAMPKSVMPSRVKNGKISKEKKHENLVVLEVKITT